MTCSIKKKTMVSILLFSVIIPVRLNGIPDECSLVAGCVPVIASLVMTKFRPTISECCGILGAGFIAGGLS